MTFPKICYESTKCDIIIADRLWSVFYERVICARERSAIYLHISLTFPLCINAFVIRAYISENHSYDLVLLRKGNGKWIKWLEWHSLAAALWCLIITARLDRNESLIPYVICNVMFHSLTNKAVVNTHNKCTLNQRFLLVISAWMK